MEHDMTRRWRVIFTITKDGRTIDFARCNEGEDFKGPLEPEPGRPFRRAPCSEVDAKLWADAQIPGLTRRTGCPAAYYLEHW